MGPKKGEKYVFLRIAGHRKMGYNRIGLGASEFGRRTVDSRHEHVSIRTADNAVGLASSGEIARRAKEVMGDTGHEVHIFGGRHIIQTMKDTTMRSFLFSMTMLLGAAVLITSGNVYSAQVDQNNESPGGAIKAMAADTITFPDVGDTRFTLRGDRFWNQGDFVEGTRVFTSPASAVEMTLMVSPNGLSCDTQDHRLMIDGTVVGTFSIPAGASQVSKTFTFPTVTAGTHTIRIETVKTVDLGCGSAGLPDGVSRFVFSGDGGPPPSKGDLTISPPTGTYFITQQCELGLMLKSRVSVVGGTATVDGRDIWPVLADYTVPATLVSGGRAFRCPAITVSSLGSGQHTLEVTLNLGDGSRVSNSVVWTVESIEEGLITQ